MHFSLDRRALNIRAVTVLAVTVLDAALLVAGCGSAKPGTPAKPRIAAVSVGVVASESSAALYVAENQGLFRKNGLDVTVKTITGAAAVLPDLLHGGLDVVAAQLTTFIEAQAKGAATFRVLAPGGALGPRVEGIAVPKGSRITSPAQLRDTTIAVNALGGINQILAEVSLLPYGIKSAEVRYVGIPFQDMGQALAGHRVAAAYLAEPYLTEAEQNLGAISILDPDTGPAAGVLISAYVSTRAWAVKNPHAAAAFGRAIDEADTLINTNPSYFDRAMSVQLHLGGGVIAAMAMGSFPTSLVTAQVQQVANLLYTYGLLEKQFNVKVML